MISDVIERALTAGLRDGYLEDREFEREAIAGRSFKTFFLLLNQLAKVGLNPVYSDCFRFGKDGTGFGFEIISIEDENTVSCREFARIYAGGVNLKELLGSDSAITEEDVTRALKLMLRVAGTNTRLGKGYRFADNKWDYHFDIVEDLSKEFGRTFIVACETLYYITESRGVYEPVSTHYIILIEVK